MNLLLLTPIDFINDNEIKITGRRFDHLKKVIKVTTGQKIDAGLLNGKRGSALVTRIDLKSITLRVQLNDDPPFASPHTLILALPRPLMLKRILQTVSGMGIKNIHLINTQRVEKSYWNSSDLDDEVIHHQLLLGLEQSRDTLLPSLYFHKHFEIFIETGLVGIIEGKHALLAHIGDYPACPCNVHQPAVLAVGPEGGFIPDEVKYFIDKGFQPVQMGSRPLRVEAAVTALLGRLLPV
jgi:RsmE family RNA methyltransferase